MAVSISLAILVWFSQPIGILAISNGTRSPLSLTAEIANGRSPLTVEPDATRVLLRSLGRESTMGTVGLAGCEPAYVPKSFTVIMRCSAQESGGSKSITRIPRVVRAALAGGLVFAIWALLRSVFRRRIVRNTSSH
jgi:hypothetical protein